MAKENIKNKDTGALHKQMKKIQIVAIISFVVALVAIFLMTKEHMTVESLLSHTKGTVSYTHLTLPTSDLV